MMFFGVFLVICSILPIVLFCGVRIDYYRGEEMQEGSGSDSYLTYNSGTGRIDYIAGRTGRTYYIQEYMRYRWNSIFSSNHKVGYGVLFYNIFGAVDFLRLPQKLGEKLYKIQRILDFILPKYLYTLIISSAVWVFLLRDISYEEATSIIVPMAWVLYIFRSIIHGYYIECMTSEEPHMFIYAARANLFACFFDLVAIAIGCVLNDQINFERMFEAIKYAFDGSLLNFVYPCTAFVAIVGIILCTTIYKDN